VTCVREPFTGVLTFIHTRPYVLRGPEYPPPEMYGAVAETVSSMRVQGPVAEVVL
jgi:hypothetical protein